MASTSRLKGTRDDKLDAAGAASRQFVQEFRLHRLYLGRAYLHAQHLEPAVGVDADGDDQSDRENAATETSLQVGGVNSKIRPFSLDWTSEERFDLVIDLIAESGDLVLRDARHARGLDKVVHRAGRHALVVGFLYDSGRSLLDHAPAQGNLGNNCLSFGCNSTVLARIAQSRFIVL